MRGQLLAGKVARDDAVERGPLERKQAELTVEHQKLRHQVSRMRDTHRKDSLELRRQMKQLTEALRGLTQAKSAPRSAAPQRSSCVAGDRPAGSSPLHLTERP